MTVVLAGETREVRLSEAPRSAPRISASQYHDVYQRALRDPIAFWGEAAQAIDWYEKPAKVFDPSAGVYGRWYVGAVCNTCFNAVDRHVLRGRGAQAAVIYDSPVTGRRAR